MNIVFLTFTNSRLAGGLYTSVRYLARSVHSINKDSCILSYNDHFSKEDLYVYEGIPMRFYNICGPSNFSFSWNLYSKLSNIKPDIIHLQGIWRFSSFVCLLYKIFHNNVKVVIAPRGMLDPWAVNNSKLKKQVIGYLYEKQNLKKADCLHALCKSEYESMRAYGLKNPIAIIPNGITIPDNNIPLRQHSKKRTLLFISRIHPKKGLKELIEGVNLLKLKNYSLLERFEIRVAGWNEVSHQEELQKLLDQYDLNDTIHFIGAVVGDVKAKELSNADGFILPSFSEGLPMSILEAWSYKLPTIMTDFCNLPEGFDVDASIRIEPNGDSIANGIQQFLSMSDAQIVIMGENGYNLVRQKYDWSIIGEQTCALYNYLFNGGEKPGFVLID